MNTKEMLIKHKSKIARKWHPTLRQGPTGAGYTYETLLGIKENNDPSSDLIDGEIKTCSSSKIRLFSKAPIYAEPELSNKQRCKKHGVWSNTQQRWQIYAQSTPNSKQCPNLKFDFTESKIILYDKKLKTNLGSWDYKTLESCFNEKFGSKNFIYVGYTKQNKNGKVEFRYKDPVVIFDPIKNFKNLLLKRVVYVAGRTWWKPSDDSKHDHGWAFQINKKNFKKYCLQKEDK